MKPGCAARRSSRVSCPFTSSRAIPAVGPVASTNCNSRAVSPCQRMAPGKKPSVVQRVCTDFQAEKLTCQTVGGNSRPSACSDCNATGPSARRVTLTGCSGCQAPRTDHNRLAAASQAMHSRTRSPLRPDCQATVIQTAIRSPESNASPSSVTARIAANAYPIGGQSAGNACNDRLDRIISPPTNENSFPIMRLCHSSVGIGNQKLK